MSDQSSVFPDSIDEVLTAVQETPRGRWFLEAYTKRIKGDGTTNILQAISRLENSLTSMTIGGADANLLNQTREAIAAAKREIAALEPKTSELSAEGQLFAKLAELSRVAFNANSEGKGSVAQGVDRVFKLVSEIDSKLSVTEATANIETAPLKPAGRYFKADEEIFEPAPAPAIVKISKPTPTVEATPRGAKLVIQRVSSSQKQIEVEIPAQVEGASHEPHPEVEAKSNQESRIVIIRRRPEETVEVPLLLETASESMTAA
jgi:hypothetical protein